MKFRMAENSLFAVLLRSPWWISIAVALGLVALAQALLPQDLRTVGSMGALPFVVIGAIACWRQWNAPSPAQAQQLLDGAAKMSWPQFEQALRAGFAREGWQVRPGEGGADLVLERKGVPTLVSARRWKAARHGEEALQALDQAMQRQEVGRGVYVALGELSPQARSLAKARSIEVLQGTTLARLLRS
ncbi:restriction endonuclease [Ramlibacter tataouinensis]|uniref:restriction endonuclease n=1 Tax=Ramlibacter tataouinensis TaxID=94132 RepID=UPI0022F3C847|nr:restriction endonuclease [Ramlibacter tataouinensis]WBY02427.1 restriction endonuclease [Ramlibacter tataouinensis]